MRILCSTAFVCSLLVSGSNANDVEDVIDLQQRAVRAAVATVSDSVIQIETLGGLESTNALKCVQCGGDVRQGGAALLTSKR